MVRLFAFLTRRSELSHEEFLDHWLNVHGPLIAGTPELARHIRRYEQHPRAFTAEPAYAELIAPDEAALLDLQRLVWVITGEPTVVIGDGTSTGGVGGDVAGA